MADINEQSNVAAPVEDAFLPCRSTILETFWVAFRLGLASSGGPIAHIGYFRDEYVDCHRWMDEKTFTDLVTLPQSFSGTGSSELGMSTPTAL